MNKANTTTKFHGWVDEPLKRRHLIVNAWIKTKDLINANNNKNNEKKMEKKKVTLGTAFRSKN